MFAAVSYAQDAAPVSREGMKAAITAHKAAAKAARKTESAVQTGDRTEAIKKSAAQGKERAAAKKANPKAFIESKNNKAD